MAEDDFDNQCYTISIYLHTKSTKTKGRSDADVPLISRPFQHPSVSNLSNKTHWSDIERKVKEAVQSTAYADKNGEVIFDSDLGIVGCTSNSSYDDTGNIVGLVLKYY